MDKDELLSKVLLGLETAKTLAALHDENELKYAFGLLIIDVKSMMLKEPESAQETPYEIGHRLHRDGYGISNIWGHVAHDSDMAEAQRGYVEASNAAAAADARINSAQPAPVQPAAIIRKALEQGAMLAIYHRYSNPTAYQDQLDKLALELSTPPAAKPAPVQERTDYAVHLHHCNIGEYQHSCKYGEDDCPALAHAASKAKFDTSQTEPVYEHSVQSNGHYSPLLTRMMNK
jgi:hypothetical protein